jgi:hypothetical protein
MTASYDAKPGSLSRSNVTSPTVIPFPLPRSPARTGRSSLTASANPGACKLVVRWSVELVPVGFPAPHAAQALRKTSATHSLTVIDATRLRRAAQGGTTVRVSRSLSAPLDRPSDAVVRAMLRSRTRVTMQVYYILPVVLIVAVVAYTSWARRQAVGQVQNLSPEDAAKRFHESYAGYFDLEGDEKVVGAWSGLEFQGAQSSARQVAGAALNSVSAAVVGVSTYVPNVHVGLTSTGRVLVSREYSELGERGNFKQICAFTPGTRALGAAAAFPGQEVGKAPKNPFNPMVELELVQLRAPDAKSYEAWMSPQGGQMGHAGFRSILQALG